MGGESWPGPNSIYVELGSQQRMSQTQWASQSRPSYELNSRRAHYLRRQIVPRFASRLSSLRPNRRCVAV